MASEKVDVQAIAVEAAKRHGVDPRMILAMMKQESGGRLDAVSSAGAKGPMQLISSTAKEMGVTDINDPYQNIDAGVKYFAEQLKTFGSPELALAAYNAGPGAVRKAGRRVPQNKETPGYVKNIMKMYNSGEEINFKPRERTVPQKTSETKSTPASQFLDSTVGPIAKAGEAAGASAAERFKAMYEPVATAGAASGESTAQTIRAAVEPVATAETTAGTTAETSIRDQVLAQAFAPTEQQTPMSLFQQPTQQEQSSSLLYSKDGEGQVAIPQNKQEEKDFRVFDKFEYDRREALMRFLGQLQDSEEKSSPEKVLGTMYPDEFDDRILAMLDRSKL